ncbi:hypothetical protein SAMD00019534_020980, partial [Acytostelium subglobosum LB1]|uniref:hypothetical protein n=1 Tax=Acytostelium subglobosum LB1 TaxID=1410327 RepID=UPI0006448C40
MAKYNAKEQRFLDYLVLFFITLHITLGCIELFVLPIGGNCNVINCHTKVTCNGMFSTMFGSIRECYTPEFDLNLNVFGMKQVKSVNKFYEVNVTKSQSDTFCNSRQQVPCYTYLTNLWSNDPLNLYVNKVVHPTLSRVVANYHRIFPVLILLDVALAGIWLA